MWNKLFKKKSKVSNDKSQSNNIKPGTSTKCFSFTKKLTGDLESPYTLNNQNFHYLQYESKIYEHPGEQHKKSYENK